MHIVTEWQGANREWSEITEHCMKNWDRTDFTIPTLPLITKIQTSLTRFTSIRLVKREDLCGAIALTYFAENCLDLPLYGIQGTNTFLAIFFPKVNQFTCDKMFPKSATTSSFLPNGCFQFSINLIKMWFNHREWFDNQVAGW